MEPAPLRLVLLLGLLLPAAVSMCQEETGGNGARRQLSPALFIFGDSLIDNGNNNDLASFAKANYYPYGIDFPGGPTGRFSNGLTMVDEIANLLGLPLIPAHSEATGDAILHGLNYASAAAGILDATGGNFVGRIPFNQQIRNFESTLDQMANAMGATATADAVSRSIVFVGMGSNDYLNNYLMSNYPTRGQYNPDQFAELLVQQYTQQLTSLYNLGARRFVLSALGSLGCTPNMIARSPNSQCMEEVENLVFPFNTRVRSMMASLNSNLPGARFVYMDIYRMFKDLTTNARSYGFSVVDTGCCGVGRNRGEITCLPFETPCPNRDEYVFWDAFHPTEAVNIWMARKAFNGGTDMIFPINIQQLATADLPRTN